MQSLHTRTPRETNLFSEKGFPGKPFSVKTFLCPKIIILRIETETDSTSPDSRAKLDGKHGKTTGNRVDQKQDNLISTHKYTAIKIAIFKSIQLIKETVNDHGDQET